VPRREPGAPGAGHRSARPTPAPRAQWLTIEDLSAELGISLSTAYKWSAAGPGSGRFPRCRKLPNGSIRIRRDWFEAWMEGLSADA